MCVVYPIITWQNIFVITITSSWKNGRTEKQKMLFFASPFLRNNSYILRTLHLFENAIVSRYSRLIIIIVHMCGIVHIHIVYP